MSILSDNDMLEIILVHNIIGDEFERDYERDLEDGLDPDKRKIIISCVERDSFRKNFYKETKNRALAKFRRRDNRCQ